MIPPGVPALDAVVGEDLLGPLHDRLGRAWSGDDAGDHRAGAATWMKISRLPSAPASSDGTSPRTLKDSAAHQSRNRASALSTASGSRTIPPFPTSVRPTWNC